MTDLRKAAQAALDAWQTEAYDFADGALAQLDIAMEQLRAALAAQAEPVKFDHGIGADRYQVVKGSFWWHIRIGDGTANVGKFHSKLAAEDMALKLLTAFRDGAFMQSRAAQPQQATGEAAVLAKVLQARLSPAAWKCAKCSNVSDCEGVLPGDNWCNSCGAMDTMQPLHALKPAPLHNEGPEEKP